MPRLNSMTLLNINSTNMKTNSQSITGWSSCRSPFFLLLGLLLVLAKHFIVHLNFRWVYGQLDLSFFGGSTLASDIIRVKTKGQFIQALNDIIQSTNHNPAQVEISKKIKTVLCVLHIGDWQGEPHHQHQNPAERWYQDIKTRTNRIMDRFGSPLYTWILALFYACFCVQHHRNTISWMDRTSENQNYLVALYHGVLVILDNKLFLYMVTL